MTDARRCGSYSRCPKCLNFVEIWEKTTVYQEGSWTKVECDAEGCGHRFMVTSDPKVADADEADEKEQK